MILDERNEFFDATLIPQAAGTSVLGDVIDLEDLRDIGNGQPIYWYVSLDVAAAGGTSVQFQLVSDSTSNLATSPTIHAETAAIALASLTPAGKMLAMIAVPLEGPTYERYLGVRAVAVGTFTGTGAVSSGLTLDPKGWKAYPEGVN